MAETPCTCLDYEPLDDVDENPCSRCGHGGEDHDPDHGCLYGRVCQGCECGCPCLDWTPLTEGCRMPDHGVPILVSYERVVNLPSERVGIASGFYVAVHPDTSDPYWRDYFEVCHAAFDPPNGGEFRAGSDGHYKNKFGAYLTAWMPAPKPFRRQA